MGWAAIIEMISAALGNTAQLVGGVMAADAQYKAVDQMKLDSAEKQRRMGAQSDLLMGEAKAQAGASGLDSRTGSIAGYLTYMEAELGRQSDWTRAADDRAISAAKTSADWQLGGSIFSWLTGGGGEAASSFGAGFGNAQKQSESVSPGGKLETNTFGDIAPKKEFDMSSFGSLDTNNGNAA